MITQRSSLKLMTSAGWIRKFVSNHPDYNNDSMVSDQVVHDLTLEVDSFVQAKSKNSDLLPDRSCQILGSRNSKLQN